MKRGVKIFIGLTMVVIVILASCRKEDNNNAPQAITHQLRSLSAENTACGTPTVVNLVAGQNMIAGQVTVSNSASDLTVTYTTSNGWTMSEIHLYVGACALIPTNKPGNPIPGQFPYSATLSTPAQQYSFTIPLSALDSCFCVAAHAVVNSSNGGTQTAWGAGTRFVSRGNWATYFSDCKQSCYEGCVISPGILFQGEPNWPGGPSVTVGGYTYVPSIANLIYNSSASDSRTAFILIASLKISSGVLPDATVWSNAAIVENWLGTLGQLNGSSQFKAPANIETAIAGVQAWESSHTCQ